MCATNQATARVEINSFIASKLPFVPTCGHIHRPALLQQDGLIYANDGDWVESLSAFVEDTSGALQLMRWLGTPVLETQAAFTVVANAAS